MMQSVWKNLISHDLELPLRYAVLGPLSHTGYPHSLPTVVAGGSMTAIRDFDPERFVNLTRDKRLNTTAGVPTMLYAISDYVEKHGDGIPTMRRFVYGGSPIPGDRLAQLHDRFGQIFTQLYGMSETVGTATALLPHEHDVTRPERLMSCGRPVPGAEVAILDEGAQSRPSR
jgi:fatty-acyl-CoA synthase